MRGAISEPHYQEIRKRRPWGVVGTHALPDFLQDNEYIVRGHRPQLHTVGECVKSVFRMHNETWNIWSHLIGCAMFIVISVFYLLPTSLGPNATLEQKLPFAAFFAGAIFCLASSSVFHMLSCHSEGAKVVLAKLDYCGIICLIVSSFAPWCYYGFYCHLHLKVTYLTMVTMFGVFAIIAVTNKKFGEPRFRPLRAGLFMGLGLTGVFPFLHYVWLHPTWEGLSYAMYLVVMALVYLAGGVIYAVRFPERMRPGVFDILGQSHQILHMCVIVAALVCFAGASRLANFKLALREPCSLEAELVG